MYRPIAPLTLEWFNAMVSCITSCESCPMELHSEVALHSECCLILKKHPKTSDLSWDAGFLPELGGAYAYLAFYVVVHPASLAAGFHPVTWYTGRCGLVGTTTATTKWSLAVRMWTLLSCALPAESPGGPQLATPVVQGRSQFALAATLEMAMVAKSPSVPTAPPGLLTTVTA